MTTTDSSLILILKFDKTAPAQAIYTSKHPVALRYIEDLADKTVFIIKFNENTQIYFVTVTAPSVRLRVNRPQIYHPRRGNQRFQTIYILSSVKQQLNCDSDNH